MIVMLRVKSWEPEAFRLLELIGSELHVEAYPQTAGFVPISVDRSRYKDAEADVVRVLEASGIPWRDHLELR
ncbi:MAG TPA: hypothetical protein VK387_05220 [Thermoleophilaceae bacterium]|nr:hypothetical protein [Thermoleophilaceae bacterium]